MTHQVQWRETCGSAATGTKNTRVAQAMLMLLATFGWYAVGKRAQLFKSVE